MRKTKFMVQEIALWMQTRLPPARHANPQGEFPNSRTPKQAGLRPNLNKS